MISEKEKFFDPRKPFASKRPETHEEWQARMGGEVLAVVRSGLYLDFRFLDMALSALTPVPSIDGNCDLVAHEIARTSYRFFITRPGNAKIGTILPTHRKYKVIPRHSPERYNTIEVNDDAEF